MKSTPELLRDMREDRDLKQSDIAEMIGTTQQQYSRYENGESDLPLRALVVLADYYDVSTDYLMGRKDCFDGVPGLDKKVTAQHTAGEILNEILSLNSMSRTAVAEYIALQKMKESHAKE
ncbi:MAG: helix-turn-helix domain-containing protein [Oscillospiraceae bacterium]|nr:helix-turn-helix domain-containing protein [Oscillospiraceae bacterium]